MTTNWLDLMGDDSNLSMASVASFATLDDNSRSKSKFDPEFDSSQQGINLLFKQNVKFLSTDNSQSRKRTFKEMDSLNERSADLNHHLPPKAKQRTNAKGEWRKTKEKNADDENKNEAEATNFSRFLTPAPIEVLSVNKNKTNTNKINEIEIIEESIEIDEKESNKIKKRKRRITPTLTLQNIAFDTDLINLNKVPILKKKEEDKNKEKVQKGPLFLNLDQFKKLQSDKKEKEKENEKENEEETKTTLSVWNIDASKEMEDEKENEDKSWASSLFAKQMARNRELKEKEEEVLVEKRTQERVHEMRMENILPSKVTKVTKVSVTAPISSKTSRESSVTSTSSLSVTIPKIIIPSNDATLWRQKQIKIGKETDGYKNYIKKYPNKDLRFRLNNNFVSTPEPKEKIGKKRWVGKCNKWRKFLHKFDR